MSKRKIITIVVAVVVVAAAAGGLWFLLRGGNGGGSGEDKVYVESVASLSNMSYGVQNRYSGVIEPQKSLDIKKNPEKQVKAILVAEGDTVEVGTPLFEYDTESIKDEIAQAKLELEGINNEITDYNNQIKTLKEERAAVSEDEKFQYTTQIQSIEITIKQTEINRESKKVEIEKKEKSLENAVVTSELAGVVKSISENGYDPYTGEELPFMTILATGNYRVKGTINEQNVWAVEAGTPVLIRSRVDETQTWTGTITEVDTNSKAEDNNNGYYYEGAGETATKYPFYIELDDTEGLMLGQHVYIEMDQGQTEAREGVWLYESYIVTGEDGSFVWADNGRQKLEKRKVELGEYNADMGMYRILSGLTSEDYIAYPMTTMYEGVPTVTDPEEVDYSSPMYMEDLLQDGDMDGSMDGDMDGDMNSSIDSSIDDGKAEDSTAEPEVSE